MKQLLLSKLPALFAALAAEQKLYIPADDAAGQANFTLWREGLQLTKKLNTVRSAKDLFFPQVENLVGFRVTGKQLDLVETRDPAEPFVLFGVRACDARSFAILDRVFLSEPQDTYYYWQANTEKGEALTAKLSMLEDTDGEAVKAQQEQTRAILKKLPLASLDLSAVGAGKTKALFDRPEWKQLSESCLGCGTCTFVCPTCQCYDIKEFDSGKLVRRFRCWDSCMYSDFTKMSAGQPRPTQLERFRQRFMHKLVYFPDNNDGIFGCVGCGRCLAKCPIHMNIVKVVKTLGEETT